MTTAENGTETFPPIQLSREQILQATSRCLREFGYDATTIRKIAGLLGCAVGSIYRYFKDKRELLSTVSQQTLEPVAAMVGAGEGFEQSVKLYHQLVTHTPETYRLMFWLAGPEADGPPATHVARLPEVVEQIVDGWARQLDAETARRCWSVLHGFVLLGRDAEETLAAVRTLSKAGSPTSGGTPASSPQPQVVVTMTEPPPPVRVQSAVPVTAIIASQADLGDDVCLL
jgi:AcrR family transcriptional regulator